MQSSVALPASPMCRMGRWPSSQRPGLAKVMPRGRSVTAFGETRTLRAWANEANISPSVLRRRLEHLPAEVAIQLPAWARVNFDAKPGAPSSWTWEILDYAQDPWAQSFVRRHPGGASLEEVGDALGLVRERVRQVEEIAMRKVRLGAEALGLDLHALLGALQTEAEEGR